ncbi:Rcm1p [Sugiyamaella lignohabitans]|uniref:Rcm1p n=1 Tax=Sugiyamaella lignohabitans TaxID=796027 RepID=A0A167EK62_9ASCO|nr:Rcm1p [Sugiyamaella lignohabitans]ANB14172.1 Rcm1p [Sugiyamaella lignohabitans]
MMKVSGKDGLICGLLVDELTILAAPVRWIRRNNIKCQEDPLETFFSNYERVDTIDKLTSSGKIFIDPHVPFLYGIHPSEKVSKMPPYQTGKIIIQDRASCFPATILNPKPGDILVDACSAPGNKTTHLASFVQNTKNSITAFERDPKRAEILKKMVAMAGAGSCVKIKVGDFTECDPSSSELKDVTGLVVDPSCSGSGIFGRGFEEENNKEKDEQADKFRLHKLSNFQFKIVSHAMSFPSAKTVVYSTCSIHAEENEQVVRKLLEDPDIRARGWTLRRKHGVLPNWHRRGWPAEFEGMDSAEELAEGCVRALPKEDGGIGFFAACFDRVTTDGHSIGDPVEINGPSTQGEEDDEEWTGFD